MFELFQEAAFPGQAIGRSILGTPESIRSHTAGRPAALPRHAILRAADGASPRPATSTTTTVVRLAEEHLGRPPRTHPPARRAGPPTAAASGSSTRPLQEAQILLGFAAPSYHRPLLRGRASLLGHPRRRHGVAAFPGGAREPRALLFHLFLLLALHGYRPLRHPGGDLGGGHRGAGAGGRSTNCARWPTASPTPSCSRAKAQLRAGLLMTLESPIARAGQMARHILIHGRPLALEEMVAKVEAVTRGRSRGACRARCSKRSDACRDRPGRRRCPARRDVAAGIAGRKVAVGW